MAMVDCCGLGSVHLVLNLLNHGNNNHCKRLGHRVVDLPLSSHASEAQQIPQNPKEMKKTTKKVATVVGFAIVGAIATTKLRKKKKTENPEVALEQRPDPNPETDLFI